MKTKRPLILIVNDDGIAAPGIRVLIRLMNQLGDIIVVAPDKPQSGMSHAITLESPIFEQRVFMDSGSQIEYSCSGTPADCIKLALNKLVPRKPDLCVSGINHGSNSSINVLYSGTMAAALEASLEGVPSIGFSLLDHSKDADFYPSEEYISDIASKVIDKGLPLGICLNVNIPKLKKDQLKGVKICRQANGNWVEELQQKVNPHGKKYYWMAGYFENHDNGEDTDIWALENNYISVVPIKSDITAHSVIQELNYLKHG